MKRCVSAFLLLGCSVVSAQAQTPEPVKNAAGGNLEVYNPITSFQFLACIMAVVFGFVVFAGQFYLLKKANTLSSDDVVKNCTITLVVVGALLLIIAGYNSQQTAQAFGLFGTVIGYLLGRSAGKQDTKE